MTQTSEAPAHPSGHAHGHSHGHGPAAPVSRRLRRVIAAVLIPFATAVVVGLAVLWPSGTPGHEPSGVGMDRQMEQAKVTAVARLDCAEVGAGGGGQGGPGAGTPPGGTAGSGQAGGGPAAGGAGSGGAAASGGDASGGDASGGKTEDGVCEKATIEITTGKDKGRTFTEIVRPDSTRKLTTGQGVVVAYAPDAPRQLQYSVTDVDRKFPMALLAGIFALAVVAVGRLRGLFALVALVVSFAVLTLFILPAILQGSNPLLVAVVGSSAIMLAALYLCHGLSARTSVAVLGTLVSLLLIGLLGSVFIGWAALGGNTSDETGLIHGLYPDIEMSGLLLSGVIIGSLGVLDDVTVTQTSAVWELKQADPTMTVRQLYRAGIRIGRDHIASVVNTLVLAYAGAALPLLLLFSVAQAGVGTVANSEIVAEEIVRTLVGSIGLIASVPVTTGLAALVVSADRGGLGAPVLPGQSGTEREGTAPAVPQPGGTAGQVPRREGAARGSRGRGRRRKH